MAASGRTRKFNTMLAQNFSSSEDPKDRCEVAEVMRKLLIVLSDADGHDKQFATIEILLSIIGLPEPNL